MINSVFKIYFSSWWLPALLFLLLLACFTVTAVPRWSFLAIVANGLFCLTALAFLGVIAAAIWNLIKKRWVQGSINAVLVFGCGAAAFFTYSFIMFASMFGPSEDGFADKLTIPDGIEIAEPDQDTIDPWPKGSDGFQNSVRTALTVPGTGKSEFTPSMPSLRRASTEHSKTFRDYVEASPDWHVFIEQGNRFASRQWSYGGRTSGYTAWLHFRLQ